MSANYSTVVGNSCHECLANTPKDCICSRVVCPECLSEQEAPYDHCICYSGCSRIVIEEPYEEDYLECLLCADLVLKTDGRDYCLYCYVKEIAQTEEYSNAEESSDDDYETDEPEQKYVTRYNLRKNKAADLGCAGCGKMFCREQDQCEVASKKMRQ